MAAVYAATHRNGKRVALKMLHSELSTNTEVRQRFVDEGYAANRVGHPGAVSVIDDDVSEDGSAFLVMDLLEGETLENRLHRRGKLWPGEVLAIIDALLDVLAAAHDKGIVHRDIKPDNVFVTRDGKVKLLDFGIARMVEPGRPRTTQSGATMGTPAFMPPEQARGRWDKLDGRTDLWAVGATMFIQLTGHQVREADTPNEELLLAMTTPAPQITAFAPDLPEQLIELVDRALAFEQDDRWPDARAMQVAVRVVQAELGLDGTISIASIDRAGGSPTESAAPVTLMTPNAIVSSAFRSGLTPWRRRKLFMIGVGAVAALVPMLIISRLPRRRAEASPQPVLATSLVPAPTVPSAEPPYLVTANPETVAAPDLQSAPPAAVPPPGTAGPLPVRPKVDKARPSGRPAPRASEAKTSGTSVPASPTVAPATESQLPSSLDPLDRRR
jgi:serine/threonine-protein kinase